MSAVADVLPLDKLTTIGLSELDERAARQIRKDRKYIVPFDAIDSVLRPVSDELRVLEIDDARSFSYESVYFDTPDLRSYLDAARRRPKRFKVRVRSYLDNSRSVLEVKLRDRHGRTVKERVEHDPNLSSVLTADGLAFIQGFDEVRPFAKQLTPSLTTRYARSTLLVGDDDRATIDIGLTCTSPDGRSVEATHAIIETKSHSRPTPLDRALWRSGCRPVTVSKYGTGLAMLYPHLPANKWHRTLSTLY